MRELFVYVLLAAVTVGPLLFRKLTPVPPKDMQAIEVFLANRGQTFVSLRRPWFGGPWRTRTRIPMQVGRPYRILAREPDGSQWRHTIAFDGFDGIGGPALKERVDGDWRPVLQ